MPVSIDKTYIFIQIDRITVLCLTVIPLDIFLKLTTIVINSYISELPVQLLNTFRACEDDDLFCHSNNMKILH